MLAELDRTAVVNGLVRAVDQLPEAFATGRALADRIDRICMVAHGSANRAMLGLQWWIEHLSPSIEVRRYFPSEFIAQDPKRLDARTLVLIASKSGTTPETVAAAEYLRGRPCITLGFTQDGASPLGQRVPHAFEIGVTPESFTGMYMLMQAVIGGLLEARDGWPLRERLHRGLALLPAAMAEEAAAAEARGARIAEQLRDDRVLYTIASGPSFTTAYVWGVCVVMEMLWLHSTALEAAEFFHGPFEVVRRDTPLVLILGEDPTRPLMERVRRFAETHSDRVFAFDSRDYRMEGIDPAIRPMVAPYIHQAVLKRISGPLSVLHGKKLTERRYMWKGGY